MWLHNDLVTRDRLSNSSRRREEMTSRSQLWPGEQGHFLHCSRKEIQLTDAETGKGSGLDGGR